MSQGETGAESQHDLPHVTPWLVAERGLGPSPPWLLSGTPGHHGSSAHWSGLQLTELAESQAFCSTFGFSFCISPQVPRPASVSSSPLSFRSVKALKGSASQESSGQGNWHGSPHTVRGDSHPPDKTSSDPIWSEGCLLLLEVLPRQSTHAEGLHWARLAC